MLKRSKIRVHPPIADHNENPYIWLPQEYNMKNTDKISYELRYNKSHVHDRKRMYKLSSEIRDLGVKPDPVVNVPVVDMSNQIGTTVCVDMINSTAKRFQHKKGRPKRIFSPVSTKATVDTNIGVPTNEDAKVEKIINMTEQQLAAMEFKDYFGTRIGRKGQSLQFIYNFDNWVFARVANVNVDQATGKTTYYYNPSEFSALNMVPSIKNIWKQKTIYIPVRFGIDVMPIEQSEALIPANDYMNQQSANFAQNVNNPPQVAQQAQQAQQAAQMTEQPVEQQAAQQAQQAQQAVQPSQQSILDEDIKYVTVDRIRNLLKNIKWIDIFGKERALKEFDDREKKADYFLDRCVLQISNPEYIINEFKIANKNDIETLEKFCKVYRAKGYNRFFWDTVKQKKTNKDEKSISYDYNISQQPVTQPSRPALPAQPVEQPATQPTEQPVEQPTAQPTEQPVEQPTAQPAQPVEQQATSVFKGTPVPTNIAPIDDDYSKNQQKHANMINDLAKLIDSNVAFKNVLTTFTTSEGIYGANTIILIKNIVHNKKIEPEVLYNKYITNLRENKASSQYTNEINRIEELFGEILNTPE